MFFVKNCINTVILKVFINIFELNRVFYAVTSHFGREEIFDVFIAKNIVTHDSSKRQNPHEIISSAFLINFSLNLSS